MFPSRIKKIAHFCNVTSKVRSEYHNIILCIAILQTKYLSWPLKSIIQEQVDLRIRKIFHITIINTFLLLALFVRHIMEEY